MNGEKRIHAGYWWESQREGNHEEGKDMGGWLILR
jgi:hypothetical protein